MLCRLLLLFMLFQPAWLWAQVSYHFSLSEAEMLWRRNNREVRLAGVAVAGAAADVKTAGQIPNPQASMNLLSISPWSGYGAGGWKEKRMDTQLRLDQLIERGGKRELRVKAAESGLVAARREADDTERSQHQAFFVAFYDLLFAQEQFRLLTESVGLYDKSLAASALRLKAGDIAPVEHSRLRIDKLRAENEARQAGERLESAQVTLAYLMGREQDASRIQVHADWPDIAAEEVPRALERMRPDVEAARQRMLAADIARELARAQRTRDVTLGVQLEHNLQNFPTNSFGVGVSVPLFMWHRNDGQMARAEADFSAAREQFEKTQAQAQGEIDQAKSALRSARDRRLRLESGLLRDAERVAAAAEFAYAKGAMGILDLLDARRTLWQVRAEAAAARADYAKSLALWRLQWVEKEIAGEEKP